MLESEGPIPLMIRDLDTRRFIRRVDIYFHEFSIVEHLLVKNVKSTEIAIQIGLCSASDPKDIKLDARNQINAYLRGRYTYTLDQVGLIYNIDNLKKFLRTYFLGDFN